METVVVANKQFPSLHTSSLSNFVHWFVHMKCTNLKYLETATIFAVLLLHTILWNENLAISIIYLDFQLVPYLCLFPINDFDYSRCLLSPFCMGFYVLKSEPQCLFGPRCLYEPCINMSKCYNSCTKLTVVTQVKYTNLTFAFCGQVSNLISNDITSEFK